MNLLCPNCGSQNLAINQNGLVCNDCGFSWALNNNPASGILFPQADSHDEGVLIKNISTGKLQKCSDGVIYQIEKESKQESNGTATTTVARIFTESAGRIFHSDQESVALCKCGNLVFKDEFARCAWGNEALCGNCQKKTADGKVYCRKAYWLIKATKSLYFLIKIPFKTSIALLKILFLKPTK